MVRQIHTLLADIGAFLGNDVTNKLVEIQTLATQLDERKGVAPKEVLSVTDALLSRTICPKNRVC